MSSFGGATTGSNKAQGFLHQRILPAIFYQPHQLNILTIRPPTSAWQT